MMNGNQLTFWTITPWEMNGNRGWRQQPVILIEGETPFFADHPSEYVEKLRAMQGDATLLRGPFWTYIGQLKDGEEQAWDVALPPLEVENEKSSN